MAVKEMVTESEDPITDFWFRSTLDTSVCTPDTNANLNIELYIKLTQINPTSIRIPWINKQLKLDKRLDSDKVAHTIKPWTPQLWKQWKKEYHDNAQRYWHGRFWLTPPAAFAELDFAAAGGTYRPNVYCRFDLILVEGASGFHKEIEVVRLKDARDEFRSNDSIYSAADLKTSAYPLVKDHKGRYHTFYQQTYIHEVGHALGMLHAAHIYPPTGWAEAKSFMTCIATDDGVNGDACYGTGYRTEVAGNIMGYGNKLTKNNALPWRHRIGLHTGTDQNSWGVEMKRVYPKKIP